MSGIPIRQVFKVFSVLCVIFLLAGAFFLIAALNFPVIEVGKRILQETVPLSPTVTTNGTQSTQFQAKDEGYYEVSADPDPSKNDFMVVRTYVSTSPNGPLLNESYASYIYLSRDYAAIYDLKPGTYYVVADFNLTNGNIEYGLLFIVYHSYPVPDPYYGLAYAFFAASLASVVISGISWAVIKRRTHGLKLDLRIGSVISFLSALLALVSTALPWYAFTLGQFGPFSPTVYSLQNMVDYGFNDPFVPSVGKAWYFQLALGFIVIGSLLALASSVATNVFREKRPSRIARALLAVSGMFVLLSPTILSFEFLNSGIPLYGIGGRSPYMYLGFLSYGFFFTIIAGILLLILSVLATISENESRKLAGTTEGQTFTV
jgi:hypothetical protein